ncbi:uncharacterized protein LOC127898748 [Citrus sinensis]|uniref:uncharacterized protein LOC127898748 n=1 Tax=Citrus sinensis TaxID=2711 RepID=UPI00227930BA|nr:uncharacterized protein LOC127898748 [Citrus sinensis]
MDGVTNRKRKEWDSSRCNECVEDGNGGGNEAARCNYGFVTFFGEAVRRIKAIDGRACITKEVRKEIGQEFKNLPPERKSKYRSQQHRADKNVEGEVKFLTRCAPDRLAALVAELTEEQKEAASEMGLGRLIQLNCGRLKRKLCSWLVERIDTASGTIDLNGSKVELSGPSFSYIMGVSDGGKPLQLEGDKSRVAEYLQKFNATSSGINIKRLSDILRNCREADDDFKVTFMLFTLCTVLCSPIGVHISSSFLFSLIHINCIRKMNWATFCFDRLMQGIIRYKEDKLAYVGGCVLYLELLFFNSIVYGGLHRDRTICPVALWNVVEIKRLLKWIEKKGGYKSTRLAIIENPAEGRPPGGGSYTCSDDECISGVNRYEWSATPLIVEGNVFEAVDTCSLSKGVVGNINIEGSSILCFVNNASAAESRQSCREQNKHLSRQYRAGPFVVPMSLHSEEIMLLEYIMAEDLDEWETLVKTKRNCLSRKTIMSLAPRRVINAEVISTLSEMLSEFQLLNGTTGHISWFLPVLDMAHVAGDDRLLEMWLRNIASNNQCCTYKGSCDRIVVPICDGIGHWYLLVVIITELRAEIWDPLASCMTTNLFLMEVHRILKCLDVVLKNERANLCPGGIIFSSCEVSHPSLKAKELHAIDCGLYVCLLMKQLHHRQRPLTEMRCDSDAERSSLILQLVNFRENLVKDKIVESATSYRRHRQAFVTVGEGEIKKQQRRNRLKSKKMGHGQRR